MYIILFKAIYITLNSFAVQNYKIIIKEKRYALFLTIHLVLFNTIENSIVYAESEHLIHLTLIYPFLITLGYPILMTLEHPILMTLEHPVLITLEHPILMTLEHPVLMTLEQAL